MTDAAEPAPAAQAQEVTDVINCNISTHKSEESSFKTKTVSASMAVKENEECVDPWKHAHIIESAGYVNDFLTRT